MKKEKLTIVKELGMRLALGLVFFLALFIGQIIIYSMTQSETILLLSTGIIFLSTAIATKMVNRHG